MYSAEYTAYITEYIDPEYDTKAQMLVTEYAMEMATKRLPKLKDTIKFLEQ